MKNLMLKWKYWVDECRRTSDDFDWSVESRLLLCDCVEFFCKFNEFVFCTKLLSKLIRLLFAADGGGGCGCDIGGSGIFGFVRAAGFGAKSVVSSESMMIKCSLTAIRGFRGGFVMRGGTGGDTSGGASKLHILFVPDESLVASK